jgi:hypothetical protein
VSNDKAVHSQKQPMGERVRSLFGRAPKGQAHEAWTGSAVDLDELRSAAADGGMTVEKVVGEGTQYMVVRLRRE